ncbi:MAG: response regulator transcription factor [Opitutae bacterium]|nr:response regulator transcription factor [Opitutae bacterium]
MHRKNLSILSIEDESLWRTFIAAALGVLPMVSQSESAPTGQDGLRMARTLRPDIVLLDLMLPDTDGFSLALDLARLPHPPRIILLSSRQDDVALLAASESHISGLLWKSGDVFRQLPVVLGEVASGRKFYPPEVRDALRRLRADPNAFFKILSTRELELMPRFGLGQSDAEIATALGLSNHTVKSHRQHVMAKLGLHSAPRLIHWAIDHGFAPLRRQPPSRAESR